MKQVGMILSLMLCALLMTSAAVAQVTVTGSTGADGVYGSLTQTGGAFAALNAAGAQTGNAIIIEITGDVATEDGANSLNGGGWTSLTIRPSGGAPRTISGTVALPLINLNGAQNVTINGLNSGGNALTISNLSTASTAGTSTIRFINDASNNLVQNTTVLGSGTGTGTGTIIVGTTTGTTGNDNITITNCNIGPGGANLPINGILGLGTGANPNDNVIISNNNIYDFFNAATDGPRGVLASTASNAWQITGNSFYQTGARVYTGTVVTRVISIENTSGNNFLISGNYIGGQAPLCGGAAWDQSGSTNAFIGIRISAGTTTPTSIQGNTIQNLSISSATTSSVNAGISTPSGAVNVGTVTPNTIGSQSTTGSITLTFSSTGAFAGLLIQPGTLGAVNFSNNQIGGITMAGAGVHILRGIRTEAGTYGSLTISGNTIGSATTANSMQTNSSSTVIAGISSTVATVANTITNNLIANWQLTSTGTSSFRGIEATGSVSNQNISGNIIRNVSTASTATGATTTAAALGIVLTGSATSNNVISANTIRDISSTTSGATAVYNQGILITGTPSTTISRNFIYNLTTASTSPTSSIVGIQLFNSSATENIYNNMIRLGIGVGNNPIIRGIYDNSASSSPTNIRFNSIYIGGTQGAATVNTACINRVVLSTMDIRNNILWNNRASTGAPGSNAGRHYCINSSVATTAVTTDFNNLYADANGGTVGFSTSDRVTLANWQAVAAGFDANSISTDPLFVDPTNATTPDLSLQASNPESRGGVAVTGITDDFFGNTRPNPTATFPDIGAHEGNFTLSPDVQAPRISYTLLANHTSTTTRTVTGFATVDDNSGTVSGGASNPRLYYKKSTDANAFVGNTSSDNGWKYAVASNSTSPYDFTIDYSIIFGGTVAPGDVIQYFVVAQDPANNLRSNPTGAAASGNPPVENINNYTGTANSYNIATGFAGTFDVGTGQTYTTLTGASPTGFFAAINAAVVTGNITVNIVSDITELGTNALNQWAEEGVGNYTMTIRPDGTTERVISGAVANGMIRFNGADRVTITGASPILGPTSTPYLRFRNTNTSNPTFTFLNDATNNTITNCNIEGAVTTSTSGVILFSTSTGTLGNSNNTISNNNIRDRSDAAGVPANAIYSSGTAGAPNASNTISGNDIFNHTVAAVNITATGVGNSWVISNNNVYQTASRATALTEIAVLGGSGHTVSNNSIGGSAADRSGAPLTTTGTFSGIVLTVGTLAPTSVQGNKISNLNISGGSTQTWQGINITAGNVNVGTITGNTIGGAAAAYDTIRTNYDSRAIYYQGSGVANIENNVIGNIAYYNASGDELKGIRVNGGTCTVRNNVIRDLKSNASSSTTFFLTGLDIRTATSGNLFEGNQIYNLLQFNATGGCFNLGVINFGAFTATEVRKNIIYNIDGVAADNVYGMYIATGSGTYSNNMIALNPATAAHFVGGIRDAGAGTNNWFYNSVSLAGDQGGGTVSTFAYFRDGTATINIKNNIFQNMRVGGTGFHIAIANLNASATGWSPGASDYNLLRASNMSFLTAWVGGIVQDLPTWRGAQPGGSGGDANSRTGDPQFVDASANLHINTAAVLASNAANGGTPVSILDDIDNTTRHISTPDIGADEFTLPAPASFTLSSPANGATGQPLAGTLGWVASAQVSGYDVYMDTFFPPTTIVSANQPGTTYGYSVSPGTYYWDVKAKNADATTSSGNGHFGFTTVFPPNAPSNLVATPTGPTAPERPEVIAIREMMNHAATKAEYSELSRQLEVLLAGDQMKQAGTGELRLESLVSGIGLSWMDNATDEDGFYVYGKLGSAPADGGTGSPDYLATVASVSGSGGTGTYSHTPLGLNEHWYYKVTAFNANGESLPASADTTTFVDAPGAPTFSDTTWESLKIYVDIGPNPGTTEEYAIRHVQSGNYVQANGSIAAGPVWQTYSGWGGASGTLLPGLSRGTLYTFEVKARNGDNVESAFGPMGSAQTNWQQPPLVLTYTDAPNVAIPDNNVTGIRRTISLPALTGISKVQVRLDTITHTWAGDLRMRLIGPTGDSTVLAWLPGGGTFGTQRDGYENMTFDDDAAQTIFSVPASDGPPITGFYRPDSVGVPRFLNIFSGNQPAGDWTYYVFDGAGGDVGTLVRWSLIFTFPKSDPDTLIVRSFEDADGNFATTGDRTEKNWHLQIRAGSPTGTVVAEVTSGSVVSVETLLDGTYYAVKADSAGWENLGYIVNGVPTASTDNAVEAVLSGGGAKKEIIFVSHLPASTVTLGVPVASGWNMVSLPVGNPQPDNLVQSVFIHSDFSYVYRYSPVPPVGYAQTTTVSNAPGYWLRSSQTYSQDITGDPITMLTIPVSAGWNMTGSISTAVATSTIVPSGGLVLGPFYKFNTSPPLGYQQTTSLEPGRGFWVNANMAGSFDLNAPAPPVGKPSGPKPTEAARTIADLNTLTIRDAKGGGQTLYFGEDATGEIPLSLYAMPPVPPIGAFDARFASNEGGRMVQTHASEVHAVVDFPIAIQSDAYPLTVSWSVAGSAVYELRGSGVVKRLVGEGELRIAEPSAGLTLRVLSSAEIPAEFVLYQNYPNPFNPSTTIKYGLPVDSRVSAGVYNIIGQQVRSLVAGDQKAGYQVVEWDGTSDAGSQLASGIYFLRLSAQGADGRSFTDVRKLMMLK
jgi:subtilisin-like proprotein convertase family protein